jgi:hypothetical protein
MTNARAVVIDGRKMTRDQVRAKGMEMLGVKPVEEDFGPEPGDHGFLLAGNLLNYYHVASVMERMYVISIDPLEPKTTRAMVRDFLKSKKG